MNRILIRLSFGLALAAGPAYAHEAPSIRIDHCTRLLLDHPDDAGLHLQRGELHRQAGHWPAAEADYGAALDLGADPAQVAVCRAALALDRGDPESALTALRLVPTPDSAALFIQARALRRLGAPAEAAAVMAQALATSPRPRPEDYLELADIIMDQGAAQAPRALAVLDAGTRRLGPVVPLILAAVALEAGCGRSAAALARLDAAPPTLGASPSWLIRRGEILLAAGSTLEAQAAFTAALDRLDALPPERRATPANTALARQLHAHLSSGVTP